MNKMFTAQNERYLGVISKINALLNEKGKILVAIDGNSGSGKSSLASFIKSQMDCNIFHMDDFFLQSHQRTKERLETPGGNVDYERFKKEILENIVADNEFSYKPFDCKTFDFSEKVIVLSKPLNIIEGSYSLHPELEQFYDLKIFLSADAETQVKRILERNGPFMLEKFKNIWIPLENKYFKYYNVKETCDIVIKT